MSFIFDLLKPAPHVNEIQDQKKVKTLYGYWRIRILYSMFIGYAFFYLTRKSVTFIRPALEDIGYDKVQLGMIGSVLYLTYGISKFVSGIFSDHSNPRYFMAFGLILTGFFNILFGFSSSLFLLCLFWGLNGWFQGWGWPPCARLLSHWYSHSERGSWWAVWNVSHNVGAILCPWIAGYCLIYFGWDYAMYIPGILCILCGLYLVNRLRDTPQSLGLPPIEKYRNDYPSAKASREKQEKELTTREILVEHVLKNKYIWLLCLASFFVYVIRTAVNDWTNFFFKEERGYTLLGANGFVSLFEVGGALGSLVAGFSSDYLFKARRGPVIILYTIVLLATSTLFWLTPGGSFMLDSLFMGMMGFSIFGPQMLLGMMAAELSHKKAAATATGFIGAFAYFGAAVSDISLGKLIQDNGWDSFFYTIAICSICSLILLLPMWNVTHADDEQSELEYA